MGLQRLAGIPRGVLQSQRRRACEEPFGDGNGAETESRHRPSDKSYLLGLGQEGLCKQPKSSSSVSRGR